MHFQTQFEQQTAAAIKEGFHLRLIQGRCWLRVHLGCERRSKLRFQEEDTCLKQGRQGRT